MGPTGHSFVVPAAATGTRLDVWLHRMLPDRSRARIQGLIADGHVTVDDQTRRAHYRLQDGAHVAVTIPPPQPVAIEPQALPLDILHEDEAILVLNKPAGLVVHPAAGHADGTLVNALLHHCHDLAGIGGELRPGIVHRLDKDTSGVMVVAKAEDAMQSLVGQFKAGRIEKHYAALVAGVPDPPQGTIETLIGRHPQNRKTMSARPARGRQAVTHYHVEETFANAARLDVRIETGRTHQIRVHMRHLGHPIVGDTTYGYRRARYHLPPAARQMLHARSLALNHPRTGQRMTFEAPLPTDLCDLLDTLRSAT